MKSNKKLIFFLTIMSSVFIIAIFFFVKFLAVKNTYKYLMQLKPIKLEENFMHTGTRSYPFEILPQMKRSTNILSVEFIPGNIGKKRLSNIFKGLSYKINVLDSKGKTVFSKEYDNFFAPYKNAPKGRAMVDIDSIGILPGKYKLRLNITSISKEPVKCNLLLRKHIPFGEFLGTIAINKFMSIFFFSLGGILAISFVIQIRRPRV